MPRFAADKLVGYAEALLQASGLPATRSRTVAEILVEGDLFGHTTHGLQLLPGYLKEIDAGTMTTGGDPETIADTGPAITWDGRRLPGPWLVVQALDLASQRAVQYGTATVVIRRSHHIACLAAYLKRATDRGLAIILASSDPAGASVTPHGGIGRIMTPNPLAAGWPTSKGPVLLDVSMSTTTNGLTNRSHAEGKPLPHPWLIDGHGNATADASAYFADPPGAILPLGGLDLGHKGYALGLMVEMMTSALGGYGRADGATGWGASVFLQVFDPDAFGGRDGFIRETTWLADAAHATPPRPGGPPVRLPGEGGLKRRADQLRNGVELYDGILEGLEPWADRLSVAKPRSLSS
ncbi:L-lactate dehydrogenase [Skermanella aerolata]|uniref:Ldh family oxidoreductase n=1 Tax=Skermanella aerolata TaxID=393310 RepID=UPI003D1917DA